MGDIIMILPLIRTLQKNFPQASITWVIDQSFYPLVSKGGLIILDEYSSRGWGESDAVDEYFDLKKVKIKSIAFSAKPTAFIIKP